jgi:hypothetical protein
VHIVPALRFAKTSDGGSIAYFRMGDGPPMRRFALAGLHCGAATAVHYAARHQERVSQMILSIRSDRARAGSRSIKSDAP